MRSDKLNKQPIAILLIASLGLLLLLVGTFTLPFNQGLFSKLFIKPASHAATSSPTPGIWTNVTSNLANMPSECGNLTSMSAVPGSNTVIAGVALDGLWASSNKGSSWVHLGTGSGSDAITNRPMWITYDPNNPAIFWEAGIYNGGGVNKTTDDGVTFKRLGSVSHDDFVSVDFTDPNRQTLLAGGHEQSQTVYKSTDGGQTWTNIGLNLPAGTGFSSDPLVINSQTYLVNTDKSWGSGTNGIYRTTDGGATWTKVSSVDPTGAPLYDSSGTIYWATGNNLVKSTDQGVTWIAVGSGLRTIHPIELPDGRLVSVGGNTLVISADGGSTWSPIGPALPYIPTSIIYSVANKAFFISLWDCGNVVPPNAIMELDYDFGFTTPTPTASPTPTSSPLPTPSAGTLPGDINQDGHVNLTDLSILAIDYGKDTTKGDTLSNPKSDINKDGAVNLTDLSLLAAHYGT